MRRKFSALMATLAVLAVSAAPALAAQEDPLAHSVLLPGELALAYVGLALVLMFVFWALSRRGPG